MPRLVFAPLFVVVSLLASLALHAATSGPSAPFPLRNGDRVVFLGDTLIERDQYHGWLEVMLTSRYPQASVTFRNLGWSADTPAGTARFGLSLKQAGREPADEGWQNLVAQLKDSRATVVIVGYGMASSFDGAGGVDAFRQQYQRLLDTLDRELPGVRVLLLSPIPHERLGPPWPDPAYHNRNLTRYAESVASLARERNLAYVPLFDLISARSGSAQAESLTENGIHLSPRGYRVFAEVMEEHLFGNPGAWRQRPEAEALRQSILRKNEWFFHRSRPANMAYIFGFRKSEQGRNATEVLQFDSYIQAEEARIATLRSLQVAAPPAAPLRVGNLTAVLKPQPHPDFEIADGLELTLWAENPLLDKPIQMNFDPQGRLWVAASEVYPQIEPGQALTDKIIVLEDSTGSGRADKATVFAEGLLIPTGVEPGDGGCYVAQSTELLHFRDTNGDGKADVRRTVLSGFGTEDTHHNLHTLRWGIDGRLYMNQAVYTRTDTETPSGVVRLKAGGMFRFDPRDQRMSVLYRGWINPWGHQFDAYGQSFVTDGAGFQGVSWAVPGATYLTLAPARRTLQSVSPGRYPKFCGIELVRSPLFPADWQGDVVTCDFRAHRLVRFRLSDQGAGYVTQEMPDLLRTIDATFRPIDIKLGPDGALYVADWSNPIIQHGEVDFRDPRRDKEHGRIWRIAPKGSKPLPRENLSRLPTPALLDRLNSPLGYTEASARRVLVERGATAIAPELAAWTARQTQDSGRLRALWMHQAFNLAPGTLHSTLLASPQAEIRAGAVRALGQDASLATLRPLIADSHPRVRLEAVRALGRVGTAEAAALALTVLERTMDPFLDYAVWLTVNDTAGPWLAALESGAWSPEGKEAQLQAALSALEPDQAGPALSRLIATRGLPADGSGPWIELIGASGSERDLSLLLNFATASASPTPAVVRALNALNDASRLRSLVPGDKKARLIPLLDSPDSAIRLAAIAVAGSWKLPDAIDPLLNRGSAAASAEERAAAWTALRSIGGEAVITGLRRKVQSATSPTQRREAVVALAGLSLDQALPEVPAVLTATADPAESEALWRALLGISGASDRLAASLPGSGFTAEQARFALRLAREGGRHPALVQTLMQVAGINPQTALLSAKELSALAQASLSQGDASRGERIYRRTELACIACHAIGGAGGKVGPDLTSIGASAPPDYLVESVLYPNAKTKEGYHAVALSTRDQRELSGVIAKENDREILLRTADNQVLSIPKANIAKRTDFGSLMPAGLVDGLPPAELRDLVKFLSSLGKPGDFDAAQGGVARVWKSYQITARNTHLGIERIIASDTTLEDWSPQLALTNGTLDRELLAGAMREPHGGRGLFLSTSFTPRQPGAVTFTLTGAKPVLGLWLDGKPVTRGERFTVNVTPGAHTLVFQIDDRNLPDSFALRSSDANFATD
ncbi:MAG: PVC-type heme-binding CxxCH protein [Opitutaceae bacterium]